MTTNKKYNLSNIMRDAWNLHRISRKWVSPLSFADCLRRAWAKAKEDARVFAGIVHNVKVAGTLMHPILVNVDMDNLAITGNTYPARQVMREWGLVWDSEKKAWTGSREVLNALCVKYA